MQGPSRAVRALAALVLCGTVMSACSVHRLGEDASASVDATGGVGAGGAPSGPDGTTPGGGLPTDGASGQAATGPGSPTGPTAGSPGGAGGPAAGPAGNITSPSEPRRASDRGVTDSKIVLGVLATAEDTFGEFGVTYDGKRHEQVLKPFVDEINRNGGINGRTLEIRLVRYSPLRTDEMQAACVAMAEDHKVFAAIAPSGFYGDAEVCMANKQTPLLTGNNSSADTNYRREQGWVRQTSMNKDRLIKSWIDWMVATGQVNGSTKHALVYTDVPEDRQIVHDVMIPYMRAKGLQAPQVAALSLGTADTSTAEAQSAVLKFKSDGVQLVWPVTNFLQWYVFLQQAEAAQYRPRYTASDFGLIASDATSFYPPAQWSNVKGVTTNRTGEAEAGKLPTHPAFAECQQVYNAAGEKIAPDADDPSKPDGIEVVNMMFYCEHLALFADAARRAGVNPTRRSFLDALGSTGAWNHRVALTEQLSFTPQKYDGADLFAIVQWKAFCTCNRQVEGFRRGAW